MKLHEVIIGLAGERFEFAGNYIYLKSALAPITFRTASNDEVILEQGDSVTLDAFTYLLISHNEVSEQDIVLYTGTNNEINAAKINGSIEVSNLLKRNSIDKAHFFGSHLEAAAAGNKPKIQLWNPAASGVLLVVHSAITESNQVANTSVVIKEGTIARTNVSASIGNKYFGSAAPLAQVRGDDVNRAMTVKQKMYAPAVAYDEKELIKGDPIIVPEGFGCELCVDVLASFMRGSFEWEEIQA